MEHPTAPTYKHTLTHAQMRGHTTKEIMDQKPTGLGERVKEYW